MEADHSHHNKNKARDLALPLEKCHHCIETRKETGNQSYLLISVEASYIAVEYFCSSALGGWRLLAFSHPEFVAGF
jgi:hypothetical protein